MFTARQHEHPVHASSGTLKTTPGGQEAELYRVDADFPRIASRDVAMSLGSKFD